jgi:hypothetical protein
MIGMVSVDFKLEKNENRGIYYSETGRCLIYLPMHETLEDLYKTINHEIFHHCFEENGESENMDELQEETLIFFMQWADTAL